MNHTKRRVVITGMDAVSCLGNTLDQIAHSLQSGFVGLECNAERKRLGFRSALTGRIEEPPAREFFGRKELRNMGESARLAGIACMRAVAMADAAGALKGNPRAGVIIGNDSCADPSERVLDAVREKHDTTILGSGTVIHSLTSSPTINLGPLLGTQGISLTLASACSSGAHALGLGSTLIQSGQQDMVVCGGTQELNWMSMAAFDAMRVFATREDTPQCAVRPFEKDRDGLAPGGGSAMLVIEELEHARARGAQPLAEIVSYAFGSDGAHVTTGDGLGAERCLRAGLQAAGCNPEDIDYINAHATGTPAGDAAEARALHAVFGSDGPMISSTKAMTGHECWMAGASEVIYSLLMMQHGFAAGQVNYDMPDPDLPPLNIHKETRAARLHTVCSNSFGFGGTNACLILRAGHDL